MKGTLFSADFIKDSSDNLRLLELNTDTGIAHTALPLLDLSGLVSILSDNSITEFVIIYKLFQQNLVDHIIDTLEVDAPFISSYDTKVEEASTIYPTSVTDTDSKFILRLAYDESAIFDSTYAKNSINVLDLFNTNNDTGSIIEYYHSSSDGVVDNLTPSVNGANLPDIISKDVSVSTGTPLHFIKLSKAAETLETRFTELKNSAQEGETLLKFYETGVDKVESIRNVSIIYGSDLDIINLGSFTVPSLLTKPTSLDSGSAGDTDIRNVLDTKHYFELTTNEPRQGVNGVSYGGIFEEEDVLLSNDTYKLISDLEVGDNLKSYFISGSPDTDLQTVYAAWEHPGSTIPSGSYLTSSLLINKVENEIFYNVVNRLTLDGGDEFRVSGASYLLVYDSVADMLKYKAAGELDPSVDRLLRQNGETINLSANTIDILDGNYSNFVIDIETTDTFFLRAGDTQVKVITHNCFPAGTEITLHNGDIKNIENITSGDSVLSYNFEKQTNEAGIVSSVQKSTQQILIEVELNDGTSISSTALHRVYTKEREWVHMQDVKPGDTLVSNEGEEVNVVSIKSVEKEVEVYQLIDVKDNHNYYANGVLVHNFKYSGCFTYDSKVDMWDGSTKSIGEVKVGDEVKSINNGEVTKGIVTEHLTHPTNDVVPYTTVGEVTGTTDHPISIDGEWIDFSNHPQALNGFKFIDNFYNLEVDGHKIGESEHNFMMGGIIASGLGDNKELNRLHQRQSKETLIKTGVL